MHLCFTDKQQLLGQNLSATLLHVCRASAVCTQASPLWVTLLPVSHATLVLRYGQACFTWCSCLTDQRQAGQGQG